MISKSSMFNYMGSQNKWIPHKRHLTLLWTLYVWLHLWGGMEVGRRKCRRCSHWSFKLEIMTLRPVRWSSQFHMKTFHTYAYFKMCIILSPCHVQCTWSTACAFWFVHARALKIILQLMDSLVKQPTQTDFACHILA